jgi:hypothetical protein
LQFDIGAFTRFRTATLLPEMFGALSIHGGGQESQGFFFVFF